MHSEKEEAVFEAEAYGTEEFQMKSFELYEEYSQENIIETVRTRMENFSRADIKTRRELVAKASDEVDRFRVWLEETKNLQPSLAHCYSTSLKSLLVGLPAGMQIARFFGLIIKCATHDVRLV